MGLPTITRGQGYRDDFLVTTNWTTQDSSGRSVTTLTTDGDTGTLQTVYTAGVNTDEGQIFHSGLSLSSTTYPSIIIRHSGTLGANPVAQLKVTYSSGSDTFQLASSTGPIVETFALTTSKTINQINVQFHATANLTGTFTLNVDFVYVFKETLTLPTAIRPLQEQDVSIIPVIPILGRQGGVAQYIGSMSPRYVIAGGLVNTTSGQSGWTNTYTADQWWQLLKGVWIEQNTIQADGNATWQWFASDEINAKVLLSYSPQQVPGRANPPGYHEYALSLTEFNVLGLSTANLPGITY